MEKTKSSIKTNSLLLSLLASIVFAMLLGNYFLWYDPYIQDTFFKEGFFIWYPLLVLVIHSALFEKYDSSKINFSFLLCLLSVYVIILSVIYIPSLSKINFSSSATESIAGDYCYPDCDNPISALKFNSDGTFNSSTSAFEGMSRWGNWEKVDNDKIKLITTRISTNSNSDKVPPPQTIYIMSNGGLKIGSTIYIKG